jgi:hypothetical protein
MKLLVKNDNAMIFFIYSATAPALLNHRDVVNAENAGAVFCLPPASMQSSATAKLHGCNECRKCRSIFLPCVAKPQGLVAAIAPCNLAAFPPSLEVNAENA